MALIILAGIGIKMLKSKKRNEESRPRSVSSVSVSSQNEGYGETNGLENIESAKQL